MTRLTAKQVANAAAGAGFTGKDLQIAVAVSIAEDRESDPDIINSIGCVGLWQIYQKVWFPSRPQWTVSWLQVPTNNATAAKVVFDASGWAAWQTYTEGTYKQFMDRAAAAISNRSAVSVPNSFSGSSNIEVGPASGGVQDISTIYLKNAPEMEDFYLMGSKLSDNIKNQITAATVEYTTDQVSQVTISVLDPDLDFLASGLCKLGTSARLQSMKLVVATVTTEDSSGNMLVTIKCRPEIIQKLKSRQGALVMPGKSPSDFVKSECEAVGANAYIQASPQRASVARDVPETGKVYDIDQTPSTWTTIQRLAQELGFICFEENNTIYFGQPTYFTKRDKAHPVKVGFRTGPHADRALSIPESSKSLDVKGTTLTFNLPLSRAFEVRCGRAMNFTGLPTFEGTYMISSVSFNLAGSTELMNVTAQTPIDPVVAPPPGSNLVFGTLNDIGTTSDGSYPVPRQYYSKISCPYGTRGGWQAGYHTGTDFAVPEGTPVYAVYDGTIAGIDSWGASYGNHIILRVGINEYAYCHLSRIVVSKGSTVKSGQVIGYSGHTGRAFGPHLHFELRTPPYKYGSDDKDPMPTLMKKGVSSGGSSIASGKLGTKMAADFVYWASTRKKGKYVFAASRNPSNANQNTFDCSSLVQWALYQAGIKNFPGDTTSQVAHIAGQGIKYSITIDKAYKTRGALLYRIAGGGAGDHVAISLGNGQTIEASSPSIGIGNQNARGRGWTQAYLVPGLRY